MSHPYPHMLLLINKEVEVELPYVDAISFFLEGRERTINSCLSRSSGIVHVTKTLSQRD